MAQSPAVQDKVSHALSDSEELQNCQAVLETLPNGNVCGHLISEAFDGLTYQQRYRLVNGILERALQPDELEKVSTLLTYTPTEWSFATT